MPTDDILKSISRAAKKKHKHVHYADIQAMTKFASTIIFFMALPCLLSVVFGFPFPYAKKMWFKEASGLYGIVNSMYFVLIALGIEKHMSRGAIFAGFAICVHEELLNLRAFTYLVQIEAVDWQSLLFYCVSVLFTLIFATVLGYAFYASHLASRHHQHRDSVSVKILEKKTFTAVSWVVYAAILTFLYVYVPDQPKVAFIILKLSGSIVFIVAFICAGLETVDFLKKNKMKYIFFAIFHEVMLVWIIWLIHWNIPMRRIIVF